MNSNITNAIKSQRLHIKHEEPRNTTFSTALADVWEVRTLNLVVLNTIPGASLTSNRITLPKGTYKIDARLTAKQIGTGNGEFVIFSVNLVEDDSVLLYGRPGSDTRNAPHWESSGIMGIIYGEFSLTGSKQVEIQRLFKRSAKDGTPFNVSGFKECFADVYIERIGR